MIRAYPTQTVRDAEAATGLLKGGELMRRAADGLARVVAIRAKQHRARRIVVLVGPGDNGGDGLFAAATLAVRGGLRVHVVLALGTGHEDGLMAARDAGVSVLDYADDAQRERVHKVLGRAHLVVDALLGIGARPGLSGRLAELVDVIPEQAYVVSVDVPSGWDPDGAIPPAGDDADAIFADETVTFSLVKPVHLMPWGRAATGTLTVVDIGIPAPDSAGATALEQVTADDVAALWPVPRPEDDKYSRGVLGVVAGGPAYPGAAVLTVTAALSAGVGMIRYAGPRRSADLVLAAAPEVVVGEGTAQAWVIGPGLDVETTLAQGCEQIELARRALASSEPCVVDAGGLALLDGPQGDPAAERLLTPHAGELARLLSRRDPRSSVDVDAVRRDPVGHARRAADLFGATVLLKGNTTFVVPPSASGLTVRVHPEAPAWLATAGSGDVLAGICGCLLASGLSALDAGSLGALVHAQAAEIANPGGPVRASDLASALARTVGALLHG